MPPLRTPAVVLRYANYGENDRMLTLLTPDGPLSVSARGCRKAASHTLAAAEVFATGAYELYQKGDHLTLTGAQISESFYPLREHYERLAHGMYWLGLCEAVAQPGENCAELFHTLLRALALLAYGDAPERALTGVFLARFCDLSGFSPRLDRCVRCGRPLEDPIRFDPEQGGACHLRCTARSLPARAEGLRWMAEARARGADMLAANCPLPDGGEAEAAEEPFRLLRAHVEARVERDIPAAKFL